MQTQLRLFRAALTVGLGAALCAPGSAAYFERADANAIQSLRTGLGVPSVSVLQRQPRNSSHAELALLTAALLGPSSADRSVLQLKDRLRVTGSTWQLDVIGDGTGAEFIDHAAESRAHALGVVPAKAPSANQLEAAGRDFIRQHLSKVIVLQAGERLVPEVAAARTETTIRRNGVLQSQEVVANRVVFTREINGIPVVGAGSKVTITFLNDASIESFRYDWPKYAPTRLVAALLPSAEILQRVQRIIGVRTNTSPTLKVRVPGLVTAATTVALGASSLLERLACGYYDPGYLNRAAQAPVQAGCYYHVVQFAGTADAVTVAAYSGAVPAAARADADVQWPEAMLLCGLAAPAYAPGSAKPGTTIQPVPPKP
jgi:hypothetical protein